MNDNNKNSYILFIEKYKTLDVICQNKLKEFFIEYKKHARDWNGLTIFYSDSKTFDTIYPLLQILSPNIQTLSIGGDTTFHPISWTPSEFIIPDDIF
jgi:hypothetical protein